MAVEMTQRLRPVSKMSIVTGQAGSKTATLLLLVSAVIALGFICAGGLTVYQNMQGTDVERGWIDHSQTVLANLQTQTQRLDRVEYNLQLFVATGDRSWLTAAQTPLVNLSADQQALADLVRDNKLQTGREKDLASNVGQLMQAVNVISESKAVPDQQILACRHSLTLLQQKERDLLRDRTEGSKQDSYRSFVLSAVYLGISLTIVMALFVFLFRYALRRQEDEEVLFAAKEELEATVRKLTERAEESKLLTSARDEMQLCVSSQQAYESVVRHMQQLLPGTSGAMLMINNSRRMVEIVASWGGETHLIDGFNPDACCGLRAGKARWRNPGKSELHCMHFVGTAPDNYLCVPLAAHGETQGFMFVCADDAATLALAEERTPLVQELVELASLSIASLNLRTKLEGQSVRDGLTGLFNRHFMEIALERELHRAGRERTSLAVLMLDVDHFKKLNDTFGHEAGDAVLREVAVCFRQSLREEDVICRYGGEEFVVIMPDTTEEAALRRAEGIRAAVAGMRTHFRGELIGTTTVSIGVAMYPASDREGRNLVQLADGALYRAKRAGRNMVMLDASSLAAEAVA
jgi:diguanylate cyclase (GGDEF)-like protein